MSFIAPALRLLVDAEQLAPGTVWLLGTGMPEAELLDLLASPALRRADAVLCDAGLPPGTLALLRDRARYVEIVPASAEGREKARRRSAALARDGWRIVRIFRREPVGTADAVLTAAALGESGIAVRVDGLDAGIGDEAGAPSLRPVPSLPTAGESFAGSAG